MTSLYGLFHGVFLAVLGAAVVVSAIFAGVTAVACLRRRWPAERPFDPALAPTVSVHLPTRNELAALHCARRCLAFDYPPEKVEILIGDDSDDPEVSARLADFARGKPRVRVHKRESNVGFKPGNLNNLLAHTRAEIVVVFDSDFLPESDFLRRIVAPLVHDAELPAVQARWVARDSGKTLVTTFGMAVTEIFHQIYCPFMALVSGSVTLCGSAEAVRTSSLVEAGGWWSGCFTEDIELSIRLFRSGKRIAYLHGLTCRMEVAQTAADLYKQQMRWAYGVTSSIRRHLGALFRPGMPAGLRFNVFLMGAGYLFTALLLCLGCAGVLLNLVQPEAPFDVRRFLVEAGRNSALTSGYLVGGAVAVIRSRRLRKVPMTVLAMMSFGIVVIFYCNRGVWRALRGKPMTWFLLQKQGNREGAAKP